MSSVEEAIWLPNGRLLYTIPATLKFEFEPETVGEIEAWVVRGRQLRGRYKGTYFDIRKFHARDFGHKMFTLAVAGAITLEELVTMEEW